MENVEGAMFKYGANENQSEMQQQVDRLQRTSIKRTSVGRTGIQSESMQVTLISNESSGV